MTDPANAKDPEAGLAQGKIRRRTILFGSVASIIAACVGLVYAVLFFGGFLSVSTLPVVERVPAFVCASEPNTSPLWPPTVDNPKPEFPVYSPDGEWYITLHHMAYRKAEELRFYASESDWLLGSYSFHNLYIYCWAEDSSGIYLADEMMEFWRFTLDLGNYIWHGPPKKILVPCQGNMNGVSMWMKAYWGVRCQFEK